ncbi:hypothetical protein ACIBI9_62015 [Nonomuraea sp. NPDC050451]|uniref:hypothetical protein n=1 Tax=Nonomuraea sp. NPDC050451 TaxID=3364364 RepID=UPI00379E8D37
MAKAIETASVHTDPFTYAVLSDIFPDDMVAELHALLPDDAEYERLRSPDSLLSRNPFRSSWRLKLDERTPADPSPRFRAWVAVAEELKKPATVESYLTAFRDWLPRGLRAESLKIGVRLYRDLGGSVIGPHTDGADKIMTCILYLPGASPRSDSGTRILRHRDPAFTPLPDSEYDHTRYYDAWDLFETVEAVPYQANTAIAMVRGPRSFHSVAISPDAPPRFSLMYRFIVQ